MLTTPVTAPRRLVVIVKVVIVVEEENLRGLQQQYNQLQTLLSVRHGVYNSILGKLRINPTGFTSIDA